ncbi:N-acetylglucosamine-6-phosphate deacetylase [Bacillus fonticola]|uniref:N-acetylglucosamine-6-phosphate deacetylase n=1 Tax=Bacillus fonticola TaxID=2728853 RepID=UPI001473B570|nr:N-acetylglucosamine-6-phosphate deacetylase [Bacillus fonticola]
MWIRNVHVVTESKMLPSSSVRIQEGKIAEIRKSHVPIEDSMDGKGLFLMPGFIDIHIHGAHGADVMDGTLEALETISQTLPQEGTTSFLATTLTQSKAAIVEALRTVATFRKHSTCSGSELLGVHLEGPFLEQKRAGAQPKEYLRRPDVSLFDEWQLIAGGAIRIVTLAPEIAGGLQLIQHLHKQNIIPSIGHSDALGHDMVQAIESGASQVTHMYNGMRGLHHREPGVAGIALQREELFVEMIADGVHVRPEVVDVTIRAKGVDRVLLITDAMRAKGLKDGSYSLGGQPVSVQGKEALLPDGTLAGSVLKMNEVIPFLLQLGYSLTDIAKMTSTNQAKRLRCDDRKGSISVGKDADFVLVDLNGNVHETWIRGHSVYKKGGEDFEH